MKDRFTQQLQNATSEIRNVTSEGGFDAIRAWKSSTLYHDWSGRAHEAGEPDVLYHIAKSMAERAAVSPHHVAQERGLCPWNEHNINLRVNAVQLDDNSIVPFEVLVSLIGKPFRNPLDRYSQFNIELALPFEGDSAMRSDPTWQALKTEAVDKAINLTRK